jgi:hypothetical protein
MGKLDRFLCQIKLCIIAILGCEEHKLEAYDT